MKILLKLISRIILPTVLILLSLFLYIPSSTNALSVNDFNAGYIISDNVFTNKSSMSTVQIQTFLNSKVPTCDTNGLQLSEYGGPDLNGDGKVQRWEWGKANYNQVAFTCLKDYTENNKSAAQIIFETSTEFNINPQVLLVLLQKEQALITDTWPLTIQYSSATGYGCPDTADCDTRYYGFTNQVRWAAYMYHAIMTNDLDWYTPYVLGQNRIYYNPNTSCGSSVVDIKNRATQALYNYTPYQPNQAVLDWKLGDGPYVSSAYPGCGAFGNINFFIYFTEWFGSTIETSVIATVFDANSDKTGERALVGLSLSKKPTDDVTIPIGISSPSNARIVGGISSITITAETWDKPSLNRVIVAGIDNNNLVGTFQYYLKLGRPMSNDIRYSSLSDSMVEDVALLQQDTNNPPNVYRLYKLGYHYFTSSFSEYSNLIQDGWTSEYTAFSYCYAGNKTIYRFEKGSQTRLVVNGSQQHLQAISEGFKQQSVSFAVSSQGSIPIYWMYNQSTGDSLYTVDNNEGIDSGYVDKGIVFNSCKPNQSPVYRLYRQSSNNYFFTTSSFERDKSINSLGYTYEGVGFYICTNGDADIYRLYNKSTRKHFYTGSAEERDKVINNNGGWLYDGVIFSVCNEGSTDVYRLFNASLKKHLYTTSLQEIDNVTYDNSYINEGSIFKVE